MLQRYNGPMRWLLSICAVCLVACATTTLKQIDTADRQLAAGDLEAAESTYRGARPNSNNPEPWVSAKIEQGLDRIVLERMRRARPWRALHGAPAEFAQALVALHHKVRHHGGDRELEQALGQTGEAYAKALLAVYAKRDRARPMGIDGLATSAVALLALPALSDATRRDLLAVRDAARDEHLRAAGAAGPLAARVHAARAVQWGAPALPRSPLDGPYVPYVRTTYAPTACPATSRALALPTTDGNASVEVEVQLDVCKDDSRIVDTTESITWTELRLDRIDSKQVSELVCEQERIPTYVCSGSPPTCASVGTTAGQAVCRSVNVRSIAIPVFSTISHPATRPARRQVGTFEVRGSYTLRINGKELREPFGGVRTLDGLASAEFRGSTEAGDDALAKGADRETLDKLRNHPGLRVAGASGIRDLASEFRSVLGDVQRRIEAHIGREYAARLSEAQASARARDAANELTVADEEWVKVALLGGEPQGRWRAWGLDAAAIRGAFRDQAGPAAPSAGVLPAAKLVTLPPRPTETVTDRQDSVQSQVPPLNEALWLAVDADWIDVAPVLVPDPGDPSQMLAFGDTTGLMIGARIGAPLIGMVAAANKTSSQARGKFGLALVDDASLGFAAGHTVSAPEGASVGGTIRLAARYQLGVGYRRRFVGGVFAGLRGEASYQTLGTGSSATSATATPFARVELALFRRTLAVEGLAGTLAGDALRHLGVYLSRLKLEQNDQRMTHFLWFHYTARQIDASFDVPSTLDTSVDADDLEQRSYTLGYGVGF